VWRGQYFALTLKSLTVLRRRVIVSALFVALPAIFIAGLYALYGSLSAVNRDPQPLTLGACQRFGVYGQLVGDGERRGEERREGGGGRRGIDVCVHSGPAPCAGACVPLLYAPSNPLTDNIMGRVAAGAGLQMGSDVMGFTDSTSMASWLHAHLLDTQVDAAVQFLSSSDPWSVNYAIWMNTTRLRNYASAGLDVLWQSTGLSSRQLAVQTQVDAAIIAIAAGVPSTSPATVLDVTAAPLTGWDIVGFFTNGPSISVSSSAAVRAPASPRRRG